MELHKAIKHIVDTEGPEIINDLRLVNILDDFKAYEDIPASKYILRAIIVDGYANKLLEIGKWDHRAVLLPNKFASITGFIPESVDLIFQSIAYGLGFIDKIIKLKSQTSCSQQTLNDIFKISRTDLTVRYRPDMIESEKETYVFSLIDFDRSREKQLNVHIENLSVFIDEYNRIKLTFELVRDKNNASASLTYSIYDLSNRIVNTSFLAHLFDKDINYKPIVTTIMGLTVDEISKIRIYWDN